jgi:large subunit ribosomal protein L2
VAPKGVTIFQQLNAYKPIKEKAIMTETFTNKLLKVGDAAPISFFEVGDFLHSIEAFPGQGSIFGRASGSYCQIISVNQRASSFIKDKGKDINKYAIIRLPSGKKRYINLKAQASLGIVYQDDKINRNIQKAGRIR